MASLTKEDLPGASDSDYTPIIDSSLVKDILPVKFDPAKHLVTIDGPKDCLMMKDLGLAEETGVSPVAASQPFQLFTKDAVEQMRAELLKPEVIRKYGFRSNLAALQVRGHAHPGSFTYDAWKHPATLKIISDVAGVELTPVMDYEIAHTNFSVKHKNQANRKDQGKEAAEGVASKPTSDKKAVVGWHRDSYPFVCVLMMSDCSDMVGGETELVCADGSETVKIRGPTMGFATVLHGRHITHRALPASGTRERITAVTSFRPKSIHLRDDSILSTVRGVSDINELYYQYGKYRLDIIKERCAAFGREIQGRHDSGQEFDVRNFKKFLASVIAHLDQTDKEVVTEEDLVKGFIPGEDQPRGAGPVGDT